MYNICEWLENIGEDLVIQIGATKNENLKSSFVKEYFTHTEMLMHFENADLVITQGGFGSLYDACSACKNVVCVPRCLDNGETLAEQNSLAMVFANLNLLTICQDQGAFEMLFDHYSNRIAEEQSEGGVDRIRSYNIGVSSISSQIFEK